MPGDGFVAANFGKKRKTTIRFRDDDEQAIEGVSRGESCQNFPEAVKTKHPNYDYKLSVFDPKFKMKRVSKNLGDLLSIWEDVGVEPVRRDFPKIVLEQTVSGGGCEVGIDGTFFSM